jgi:hypothetical protein
MSRDNDYFPPSPVGRLPAIFIPEHNGNAATACLVVVPEFVLGTSGGHQRTDPAHAPCPGQLHLMVHQRFWPSCPKNVGRNLPGDGRPTSLVGVLMQPPALSLRDFEGDIIITSPSCCRRSLSSFSPAHVIIAVVVVVLTVPTFNRLMTAENRVILLDATHTVAIAVTVARSLNFLSPANVNQCRPPPPPLLSSSLSSATALLLLLSFIAATWGGGMRGGKAGPSRVKMRRGGGQEGGEGT